LISRIVLRSLIAAIFIAFGAQAFATDNYQTDIGPTPKNGRQGANVQGRGTVLATLEKNTFSLHGKFSGLSSPATEAHLYMGNVMGGGRAFHRRPRDCAGTERRHFRDVYPDGGSSHGSKDRQTLRHAQ
jgi:hypothetical protein